MHHFTALVVFFPFCVDIAVRLAFRIDVEVSIDFHFIVVEVPFARSPQIAR